MLFAILLCCVTPTFSQFTKLEDGLLILDGQDLKAINAEWTLLMAVEQPPMPKELVQNVELLDKLINQRKTRETVASMILRKWDFQLARVYARTGLSKTPDHRQKRALLGFLGPILHSILGVVSDSEMQAYSSALVSLRGEQKEIVHRQNDFLSILNHTQMRVRQNTENLNGVIKVLNSTTKLVNELYRQMVLGKEVSVKHGFTLQLEVLFGHVETMINMYMEDSNRYLHQYASLELGRLTEELLPMEKMEEIIGLAERTTPGVTSLRPVQWYYQHLLITPLWLPGKILAYKVVLPLVEPKNYIRYELMSWPVPYNDSNITAQLEVPSQVAIDTSTGSVFTPHRCVGTRPPACRTGPIFLSSKWKCTRGILTDRKDLLAECPLTLRRQKKLETVAEIYPGEYVVQTWKTSVVQQCLGKHGSSVELSAGTYHVQVPEGCRIQGDGWVLPGMLKRTMNRTLLSRKIEVPVLSLTELIPEEVAHRILSVKGLDPHEVLPPITLSKLEIPQDLELPSESPAALLYGGIPVLLIIGLVVLLIFLVKSGKINCSCVRTQPEQFTKVKYDPSAKDEEESVKITLPEIP